MVLQLSIGAWNSEYFSSKKTKKVELAGKRISRSGRDRRRGWWAGRTKDIYACMKMSDKTHMNSYYMLVKSWHSSLAFPSSLFPFISDPSLNPVMLLLLNCSSSHLHTRHLMSLCCLSASSPVHSLIPRGPEGSTCPQSEGIGCLSSPVSGPSPILASSLLSTCDQLL